MSLVVTKVLASHTFADFRSIFNANADDAIIVRGETDTDVDGVPLIRFLTESDESFEILLSDFYSITQVDELLADLRTELLAEFETLTGTGGGGGGGGSLPIVASPIADIAFAYGEAIEILLSPNNATSPNGTIDSVTVIGLPGWLSYNSGTRIISGTAPTGATGSYPITVRYTDSIAAYVDDVFKIQITSAAQVVASEHIWAGMLVNIYDDGGVSKMRPAIGTDVDHVAHGYIDKTVKVGQAVEPRFDSIKTYIDLVPGEQYFLSWTEPGGISTEGPDEVGLVWQPIGYALSTTELLIDIDTYILIS
ncbi:hypothetical protein DR864_28145 [Runella rosea]|uniref:Uncharacterized protein n=1 Tax=Runella rosea TaxID=2259595 RepID=A0A344TRR5_9BACT|nr:Ig domain-containing protein [Runella rosea]AXE16269.1 hypothetical protein DR864_00280 [Runella rosea]AXE21336.1 hypothetical protein DR864_28145 [Runella rosea]